MMIETRPAVFNGCVIRCTEDVANETWYHASDVMKSLRLNALLDSTMVTSRALRHGVTEIDSEIYVNYENVLIMIFWSNEFIAKEFKKKITDEFVKSRYKASGQRLFDFITDKAGIKHGQNT